MPTLSAPGPRAARTLDEADLADRAAQHERDADTMYEAACSAALRSDYREAGLLLSRHAKHIHDARALCPA